jgi:hypothetical protein
MQFWKNKRSKSQEKESRETRKRTIDYFVSTSEVDNQNKTKPKFDQSKFEYFLTLEDKDLKVSPKRNDNPSAYIGESATELINKQVKKRIQQKKFKGENQRE